jgi:O-antigen/teichoic acid export membrane protein
MTTLLAKLKKLASGSKLRRNIGMTLVRQLLAAFAQLLLVVLIARELGPEGNGFYAMAILVPTMLANVLNLGVGPATVFHVSRGDHSVRRAVAGNLKLALLVSAVGVALTAPALAVWGQNLFPGVPLSLLYIGLAGFPLALLVSYFNTILQGLEDFKAYNASILAPPYVNLAGVVVALYLLESGVAGAMVAYIVGQLAALCLVTAFLRRHLADSGPDDGEHSLRSYSRSTLGYGWKAHLSNILAFVNYRSDIFLVNLFLSPVATGIYVIAVQIAERLWILSQAASTVLLPRLSAMRDEPLARLRLTNRGFLAVALVSAVASACAALALYWFIGPLFGDEYKAALPAFLWLLPGIVAGAGARVQSNCIAASGRPEWNLYSALAVVAINIVCNILLIPGYGILGAAWATSLAYTFNAGLKSWLVRKTLTT